MNAPPDPRPDPQPGAQPVAAGHPLRAAGLRAGMLWLIDGLVLGQGGIAVMVVLYVLFFGLPAAALRKRYAGARRLRFQQVGLYLLAAIAVFTTLVSNNLLAEHRARGVIEAVNAYHAQHRRYPQRLTDLVPNQLPEVPAAKFTLLFNGFHYIPTPDSAVLFYTATPPFGRPTYDFRTGSWGYVD